MSEIEFTIEGEPKAQQRHRHTKRGHVYDPSAKAKEEFAAKAAKYRLGKPIETYVSVTVKFYYGYLKKHYDSKGIFNYAAGAKTSRPDIDNMIKFVLDSLNGIFWVDDSQVVEVHSTKEYGTKPQTRIRIGF